MTYREPPTGEDAWEAKAGAGHPARLKLRLSRRKWAG